jgi:hypothetical protein
MYVAAQFATVLFYLLLAAVGAFFARRRGGSWRAFVRGAIWTSVASTLGGLFAAVVIVVFQTITHQKPPMLPAGYALLGGVMGGGCEEIARVLGIRSGRDKLSYGFGQALMFGTGFAGAELVWRDARIIFQTVKYSSAALTPLIIEATSTRTVVAIEIFVWHICMAILAYRLWSDTNWRRRARVLAPSMVAYHVSANLMAGSLSLVDPPLHLYALAFWTVLTPFHVAAARSVRCVRTSVEATEAASSASS